MKVALSSGHGLYVRGAASDMMDEVDEARKMVEALADELNKRDAVCLTYHDDRSKTQSENLQRICDWHNSQDRDIDISCHFNAFEQIEGPRGCEVWYVSQQQLAARLSEAIASVGFINRGAKYTNSLKFLNSTHKPAVLLEICFVDSETDCQVYYDNFPEIADAMADVLGGAETQPTEPAPPLETASGRVDIQITGNVIVTVNGIEVDQS